jgi:hypothetical protein
MSVRDRVALLLVGCLGWLSADAFAQQSRATDEPKWELEVHAGGVRFGNPTDATTAMPPPGEAFTTLPGRPSRYVSSWYFGDGAAFLNQWAAAFTIIPRTQRITPLDPVLTGPVARPSHTGSFGVRTGRRLTPRLTAEVNVDYGRSTLELSERALGDIEASRATFAGVWNEALTTYANEVVASSSQIEAGTGGQIVATGALIVKLRRGGALVPYATGGLGGAFNHGRMPSVTLRGNYSMGAPFNPSITFDDADTVTVRFARPDRTVIGVVGGGFTYDLARRHGVRIDLRLHITPNAVDTEVSAGPSWRTGTPAGSISSATIPSVAFNNRGSGNTFSGPAITAFKTREGSGWQIDTAFTVGYFWRF